MHNKEMDIKQEDFENQSAKSGSTKYNNTISSVAYMLGVSEDAVYAWTKSKEFEHIQNLEKEKQNLINTVHRVMSDRIRIKEEIGRLFEKVKA